MILLPQSRCASPLLPLPTDLSGGTLHADWAKLTQLATLNLSGNNLSGDVSRELAAFFDDRFDTVPGDTLTAN